jgi:D-threonate/D-erythronate kinase
VYAPAYPAMKRTVRCGRLYVDGVPLELTAFARDPSHPARTGEICSVLGDVRATVLDGETDLDVRDAARRIAAMRPFPLAAGPAALAGALAAELDLPRAGQPPWPRVRNALVVNGSLHPASLEQTSYIANCPGWRLLEHGSATGSGAIRAARVAELARAELERRSADALVIFGGDTAFALHRALGGASFEPVGEVVPGAPVSRSGGLTWITKAGGFGSPAILCEIQMRLR